MAKREIYARLGVQLRNNRRVFRAEKIAPGSFGLYCFCVMDARAELPDQDGKHSAGFVAEEVVLGALGRPHKERMAQAEALCAVDLLERSDGGFVVVKYDEHNDTFAVVTENRKAANARKGKSRGHASVTRDSRVPDGPCHGEVPISYSLSPLPEKDLPVPEGESARGGLPRRPTLDTPMPDGWRERAEAGEMTTGEVIDVGAAWEGYRAWCVDDERRPFTEARWVRWCGDERKRAKERRVNNPSRGTPRQPLGNRDEHEWLKAGGGGEF